MAIRKNRSISKATASKNRTPHDAYQKVAEVACRLYEQRGRPDGYGLEDWLEAERQVLTQKN